MDFFEVVINIFGGLAIFLFAMKALADSLQSVVGPKIESVLTRLTDRAYKGMFVGAFVTFITQSSSITVLTLIGLVNVGVLSFKQGLGILLGAEIGTTITAQLVTLDLGDYFFPLLIIGLILSRVKKEKLESYGKILFSFGLLFFGMHLMKTGAAPIKDSAYVVDILKNLGNQPLLGIVIGAVFTGVTSSSSATTSLIVALGVSNVITLPAAIAIMLGANIGTTLLELLAVMGLSITSKRVAVAQAIINVLGVMVIFPFIAPYSDLIAQTSTNLAHQIANSHTIFNVGSSVFFLMISGAITSLSYKIIPGKVLKLKRGTKYLDPLTTEMPHIGILNANKETAIMGREVVSMFEHLEGCFTKSTSSELDILKKKENYIDYLRDEIYKYLGLLSRHELAASDASRLTQLIHGVTDIERAGDHLYKITMILQNNGKNLKLGERETRKLAKYIDNCESAFKSALRSFVYDKRALAKNIPKRALAVSEQKDRLQKDFKNNENLAQMVHHFERAAHHGENLSQIVITGV